MPRFDVLTIFPRMIEAGTSEGIVARAVSKGLVTIGISDLREFTHDRHRSVDDAPFGGGPGMVMKAEPFFDAVEALPEVEGAPRAIVLLSPRGKPFDQRTAERYATLDHLILLCGRYEGVDERVASDLATEELSLGDFVLTGGETPALAVIEATVRLLPGALGDEESAAADSFSDGVLDHAHFTRPAVFRGQKVPEALLSGDHERIRLFRRKEALRTTLQRRPGLFKSAHLTHEDRALLREIEIEEERTAEFSKVGMNDESD
jgi:tRNA (guanine37-N1)-methyltransferase